jgi:mannose-6-phosphate isomerase-like protein (cupin superfamily)
VGNNSLARPDGKDAVSSAAGAAHGTKCGYRALRVWFNHPEHCHGFAQVWYILSGEFTIEGKLLKAGTMLFHPDPSPRVRRAAPHLIFHLKKNPWTFPLIPVLEAQGPFRPNQI